MCVCFVVWCVYGFILIFFFYNALFNPINDLGCALGHIYRAPGEAMRGYPINDFQVCY